MKEKHRLILKCFLWNFIIGMLAIVPFMIRENGCFSLGTDYDNINMPLWTLCRRNIWQGNVSWSWSADLGTDFIGAFSFLALGSPFYWLTLLLPNVDYLYLGGWTFILKYAVAGMTSGIYISRFEKKPILVITGSILYAFSGFQATNLMMGSFHDVVAFFPLLLIGLEIFVSEGKKGYLAAAVCLNALTNYYFFIGEVIFLILYFLIKFVWEDRLYLKKIGGCIWEGIVGVLMSAILFVPSILFVLENPRSSGHISIIKNLLPDIRTVLKLWRAFFFPGEAMQNWTCIQQYDWSSCSAWLPMVGILFVICYIWGKRTKKDWLKRMLLVCSVMMVIPCLNAVFTLMTDVYYRWYYMPLLLFALASVKVMDRISEYPVRRIALIVIGFMVLFVGGFALLQYCGRQIILNAKAFGLYSIVGILGIFLTGVFVEGLRGESRRNYVFLIAVSCFAIISTMLCIGRYQECRSYSVEEYQGKKKGIQQLLEGIDGNQTPYAILSTDNLIGAYADIPLYGSAYSSVQGSIFTMWNGLGKERRVVTPEIPEGYAELVGAKYMLHSANIEGYTPVKTADVGTKTYYLYEIDTRPIGVSYEYYILQDDFQTAPVEERPFILQQAIVVTQGNAEKISSFMKKYEKGSISEQTPIQNYHKENSKFTCQISTEQRKMCFFAVPFAKGWTAYVNGVKTEIFNTNGLMAVEITEGVNKIEFRYFNKDLLLGAVLSVCGWLLFIIMVYRNRKHSLRK